jgi:multidrug efflux pump subunit AcrA (membrane-fusion protein)
MIASITIGAPSPTGSVTVVPISAVVRSPSNLSGFAVFVAEGTGDMAKVHTQDVTLGNTYGNMIAVRSGVILGDRVVTSGTNMIKNGDEVRIIP